MSLNASVSQVERIPFLIETADLRRMRGDCSLCAYGGIPCERSGTDWKPIPHQRPPTQGGGPCNGHKHKIVRGFNPGYI